MDAATVRVRESPGRMICVVNIAARPTPPRALDYLRTLIQSASPFFCDQVKNDDNDPAIGLEPRKATMAKSLHRVFPGFA